MQKIVNILLLSLLWCACYAQDATVVDERTEVECSGSGTAVCKHRRVLLIHNEHGADMADFVTYCSPSVNLTKFAGVITDGDGKVLTKVKKKDLTRSEYSDALAVDDYMYFYSYSPARYPVLLTYEWEEQYTAPIMTYPGFVPQSAYNVDVTKASYRFETTPGNDVRFYRHNCSAEVRRTEEKGKIVYEVEVDSLPAIKKYAYSRPLRERIAMVYFAPAGFDIKSTHCDLTSWSSLGSWVSQLLGGRDVLPQELVDRVHQLTDTCTSDRSRVMVLRRWMGETTRYVSIQLGIGGWQPMTAADVYRKGIGDCKALSNYLRAMLQEVGVRSCYTLISTRMETLLTDFPTMSQLNHVILMVPLQRDTMWIECTNARVPTGYAPASWAGHECLAVGDDGVQLLRVPVLPVEQHTRESRYQVQLSDRGDALVSGTVVRRGRCYEAASSLEWMQMNEQKKALLGSLNLPAGVIEKVEVHSDGPKSTMTFEARSVGYARRSGNRLFVPVTPSPFAGLKNTQEPRHEVDMRDAGSLLCDTVRILIPAGWTVEHLPKQVSEETPFGRYQVSLTQSGNEITAVLSRHEYSGLYGSEMYAEWVNYRKKLQKASKAEIVLLRTGE